MKITNLIPMAGEGMRFINEGFHTPKPLIMINGIPMVVRAISSLPKADLNILIIRKEQISPQMLKKTIGNKINNLKIIDISHKTKGQADTCLIAKEYIGSNSILNIGSCDVGFEYSINDYINKLTKCNSFIWTYTHNKNVLKNPEMYGWVKIDKNDKIEFVSCKKPVSKNLLTDPVVSGTFTFKNPEVFFNGVDKMIVNNDTINGEYYVDNVFNHIEEVSCVFRIKKHFSWGTPSELNNFLTR